MEEDNVSEFDLINPTESHSMLREMIRDFVDKNLESVLEELVDQFLWINTSLGNWSYVLRALELKLKLAGQEKREWNYEEMLNS